MLILFIAGNPGGVRIQRRFAIHQEAVLMMAVTQLNLGRPPTVHRPPHGVWVPLIEITHEFDRSGAGCGAIEVNRAK